MTILILNPIPNDKILVLSKLKTLADDKIKVAQKFKAQFSVFKRPILQTRKNQGLFGKGLKSFFSFSMVFLEPFILGIV